jgi:hypothetical protein
MYLLLSQDLSAQRGPSPSSLSPPLIRIDKDWSLHCITSLFSRPATRWNYFDFFYSKFSLIHALDREKVTQVYFRIHLSIDIRAKGSATKQAEERNYTS